VPELSRFFGIIVRMYAEAGAPHHAPHFHVYYQENVAILGIDPVEVIAGELPPRQRRFVEASAIQTVGEGPLKPRKNYFPGRAATPPAGFSL
jgi:hypothetical protein